VSPDNVMSNKSVSRNASMRLKNKMFARFAPSSIQQVQPVTCAAQLCCTSF